MTPRKGSFSSETVGNRALKMGFMRTQVLSASFAVSVALASLSPVAIAASAPLDFSYRVTGANEVRPLLVFNDGVDTFIQPQDPADKALLVNGSVPVRQGPYFVVSGVAREITITGAGRASARISYARTQAKAAIAETAISSSPRVAESSSPQVKVPTADRPIGGESAMPAKAVACQPRRETRVSAFVATFKAGTSTLSDLAKAEVKKFIGDPTSISGVDITAEGTAKVSGQKRADAIKAVLLSGGIDAAKIHAEVRSPLGIGSEIHIHRTVEIPCGSAVVRIPSRKGHVTVIWDRKAKELAERIASELKVKLTVTGEVRDFPVRVAAVDMPFNDAMQSIGQALDEGADLILRSNELILSFKEKK